MRRELSSRSMFIGHWEIYDLSDGEGVQLSAAKGAGESAHGRFATSGIDNPWSGHENRSGIQYRGKCGTTPCDFSEISRPTGMNSAPDASAFLLDWIPEFAYGEADEPISAVDDSPIANPLRLATDRTTAQLGNTSPDH
jgi:hypothetical protein